MAARTRLAEAEARALVGEYGLDLESIEPLAAYGTINSNFRLHASRGRWFLRVNEGKTVADAEAEARLVAHLKRRGMATPEVVPTQDGRQVARFSGKPVSLFPWVEGREAAARPDEPERVAVAGEALAALHRAGEGYQPLPRDHYSLDELGSRLERFAGDARFAEVVPALAEELERARVRRRMRLPEGLVHQDLFPDNVLVDEAGRLRAVLDFEQA